jgi:hypothetical protein
MTQTLNDINCIIMPLGNDLDIKNRIDSLFENLIVHDNQIFNTYIFNHITWKEYADNNFQQKTLDIIAKHFVSYIRKKLQFFRENNKKNKFTLSCVNNFFEEFYKLLMRVNNTIIHFTLNKNTTLDTKKWGSSYTIDKAINNLCSVLLNDMIINIAINKNIASNIDFTIFERNDELYNFMKRINLFANYVDQEFNDMIISVVDDALVKNIPSVNRIDSIEINTNILDVYQFKSLYQYFIGNNNKYYYVSKRFTHLFECVGKQLMHIINSNDIQFLQYFIKEYKHEIINLSNYIDVFFLILSKNIQTLENMINYYGTLYNILLTHDKLISIVHVAITQKISLIESIDTISELIDLIHADIINGTKNEFLYLVASHFKNKDLVISLLCNKLMYRIIYCTIRSDTEIAYYTILNRFFNKKETYQYYIILNDYTQSQNFMMSKAHKSSNENTRLIITSLDSWRFNHKTGHIRQLENTFGIFSKYIYQLLIDYKVLWGGYSSTQSGGYITTTNKILILYPHIGSVEITVNNSLRSTIILTPAQMLCLELFENNEMVYYKSALFDKLKEEMLQYSDSFIQSIIKSLVEGSVLIEIEPEILSLNDSMPASINLIKIFNNINCTALEIMKDTIVDLAHTRNDIIMTNIMSIVKNNSFDYDKVYEACKKSITLFDTTKELYEIAIKTMCDKKYIAVNENYVMQIIW